ncbi:MAG TPA: ABC-type transport auxiliary lipoprotein family protein [Candidatus Fermentibacter daniensis]|nr:ABC-type transport auxiliary lipoprotein family protein [Candidatus Fermentibacter daniensis]HOR07853.1 ABC-type transport auxiliary lipoprotein family protein [Candidatus Fermentibacter daniensis]HPK51799.1 ABC-type transport auxiliary lipoprotein family protein [Candidatus Fermentibacter daniensis]
MKRLLLTASAVLLTCSCITIRLAGRSSEQTVHSLECPDPPPAPPAGSDIRVRDFSCSTEYDRTGMVLVDSSGLVTRTSTHRWASSPGISLSDLLARHLLAEGSFDAVLRRSVMTGTGAIVEGHVAEFGARQIDGVWHAVLDTDLILSDARSRELISQKRIRLSSPMPSTGFDSLAAVMSTLASRWSGEARAFIHDALEGFE